MAEEETEGEEEQEKDEDELVVPISNKVQVSNTGAEMEFCQMGSKFNLMGQAQKVWFEGNKSTGLIGSGVGLHLQPTLTTRTRPQNGESFVSIGMGSRKRSAQSTYTSGPNSTKYNNSLGPQKTPNELYSTLDQARAENGEGHEYTYGGSTRGDRNRDRSGTRSSSEMADRWRRNLQSRYDAPFSEDYVCSNLQIQVMLREGVESENKDAEVVTHRIEEEEGEGGENEEDEISQEEKEEICNEEENIVVAEKEDETENMEEEDEDGRGGGSTIEREMVSSSLLRHTNDKTDGGSFRERSEGGDSCSSRFWKNEVVGAMGGGTRTRSGCGKVERWNGLEQKWAKVA